jgi:outer membrane protein assembly factor BamB
MKKTLLCAALLAATGMFAQDFQWQWAKRGGGTDKSLFENGAYDYDSEQVVDVVIDADNNYYFLANITENNTEFDGTPVTVYNAVSMESGYTDAVIIATDCEGTLRWTQAIGGGDQDFGYSLSLDNNGGLYIGMRVNNASFQDGFLPPHFNQDDAMPVIEEFSGGAYESYRSLALLKYDTDDGELEWRVMPQGAVDGLTRWGTIKQIVDSQGIIHALVGLRGGTHLEGEAVVPDTYTFDMKHYIVKYDSDGNQLDVLPLTLEGYLMEQYSDFRYDENLGRYYLAGFRNAGGITELQDLSFNGTPFTQMAFILAFTETGEEVWRKEPVATDMFRDDRFYDIEIDDDSNIYVTGKFLDVIESAPITMGDFEFPSGLQGNVMYIMKLNAAGEPQWINTPDGYNLPQIGNIFTGMHLAYDLVINGNRIAVATQICNEIWGDIVFDRPTNHRSDPAIMILDKATGETLEVHDVMGTPGLDDAFTAITVDNDGNYVAGGPFLYELFTTEDDNIPTLHKVLNSGSYTDFFMAKLAAGPCGIPVSGTANFNLDHTMLYPNPASSFVSIQTDDQLAGYEITNMQGRLVARGNFSNGQDTLSVESLSSGIYLVKLRTVEGKVITEKLVKE